MGDGKKTISAEVVDLALARYRLGQSSTGEPFAVALGGHIARPLRGGQQSLRAELAAIYFDEHQRPAPSSALADALSVLEGRAQSLPREELALRSHVAAGRVLVDVGDEAETTVVVGPNGWSVEAWARDDVLFRRTKLTAALPIPASGGTLDELRDHVNVAADAFPLLLAWLVCALLSDRPCPVLLLLGEQGVAKTTTARRIVALLDPSPAPLRPTPPDPGEWAVTASASRVVGLDNLSTIPPWFSDALCRAVTGDGLAKRQLYADTELILLTIRRAVILTSIDAGVLRGDLADRLLVLDLERIQPGARREDATLDANFTAARPRLLGALYDLIAQVLARLPNVHPEQLPRMADFGRILATIDELHGTTGLARYLDAGRTVASEIIDSDPLARAIRDLTRRYENGGWSGTAGQLLDALPKHERPPKGWPTDATRLGGKLKRIGPALRADNIDVDIKRTKHGSQIHLTVLAGDAEGDAEAASVTLSVTPLPLSVTLANPTPATNRTYPPEPGDAGVADDAKAPTPLCCYPQQEEEKEKSTKTAPPATPASPPDHEPPELTDNELYTYETGTW